MTQITLESLQEQIDQIKEQLAMLNRPVVARKDATQNLHKARTPESVIEALQDYLDRYWNSTNKLIPYGLVKKAFTSRFNASGLKLETALPKTIYKIGVLKAKCSDPRVIYPPEAIASYGDDFERNVIPDADFFDDLTSEGPFANPEE